MKSLGVIGEKFQKNLQAIVREAYSTLFDAFKGDLQNAKPQDIINFFRGSPYAMAPTTANQSAKVFVSLAQKAEIPLSQEIVNKLSVSLERKKPRPKKKQVRKQKFKENAENMQKQLPEGVLARIMLADTGYVDIKDRDDFEIAKAYWKTIMQKLGVTEKD